MTDVSVLIVTWNSAGEIKKCIDSVIMNSKDLAVELIIIDNNSTDDTFSIVNRTNYHSLQTYLNSDNLGFTKAVNQAIGFAHGRYLFLLNPDTILSDGCIKSLFTFLENNGQYSACAPKMLNEDGTIQFSVRSFPDYTSMLFEFTLLAYIFPKSKFFGRWKMKYYKYDKDDDIMQPMAAAFMFRRESIEKMDERFYMFFNDVDICKRIINNDKKIRLITSASVIHKHGESINKDKIKMIKTWNRDCAEYFKKYHPNPFLITLLKFNLKLSEMLRILFHTFSNK
jgi:GT2 family glycosyltransferase